MTFSARNYLSLKRQKYLAFGFFSFEGRNESSFSNRVSPHDMKKTISSFLLALLAVLLLNTASAQNSTTAPTPGPPGFSEPDYDYLTDVPCTTDQECLGDYTLEDVSFPFCVAEICVECRTTDDCDAPSICEDNQCTVPPCATNTDCPNGKECLEGTCEFVPCETNDDCKDEGSPGEEFICTESKFCHSVTDYGDYDYAGFDYVVDYDYETALSPGGSPGIDIISRGNATSTTLPADQKSGAMSVALVSTVLSLFIIGVMFA